MTGINEVAKQIHENVKTMILNAGQGKCRKRYHLRHHSDHVQARPPSIQRPVGRNHCGRVSPLCRDTYGNDTVLQGAEQSVGSTQNRFVCDSPQG